MNTESENAPSPPAPKGQARRFIAYWRENIKAAKDAHENGMLLLAGFLGLIWLVCFISDWRSPLGESVKTVAETGAIIFAVVWCFAWIPFRRHELLMKLIDGSDNNLRVDATLSLVSFANPPSKHCALRVSVLNMGKKVARVERVAVYGSHVNVPKMPVAPGVTVGKPEMNFPQTERMVEIPPEGGKAFWELQYARWPQFVIHKKGNEDAGAGYVRLTSGDKLPFEFPMMMPAQQMILELANPDA